MKLSNVEKGKAWQEVVNWARQYQECDLKKGENVIAEFFPEDIEAILFINEKLKRIKSILREGEK